MPLCYFQLCFLNNQPRCLKTHRPNIYERTKRVYPEQYTREHLPQKVIVRAWSGHPIIYGLGRAAVVLRVPVCFLYLACARLHLSASTKHVARAALLPYNLVRLH